MTTATPEDRRKLLAILPDEWFDNDLIASIVDDDYELYELLLQQHNRKSSSLLAPLHRSLDSVWEVFAKLAYRHGHTTEEIAEHTLVRINSVTSYVGKLSDHWKYRVEEFETLAGYEDEVIQEVAAVGRQKCLENYEYWKAREDEEDVYGQDWD